MTTNLHLCKPVRWKTTRTPNLARLHPTSECERMNFTIPGIDKLYQSTSSGRGDYKIHRGYSHSVLRIRGGAAGSIPWLHGIYSLPYFRHQTPEFACCLL